MVHVVLGRTFCCTLLIVIHLFLFHSRRKAEQIGLGRNRQVHSIYSMPVRGGKREECFMSVRPLALRVGETLHRLRELEGLQIELQSSPPIDVEVE